MAKTETLFFRSDLALLKRIESYRKHLTKTVGVKLTRSTVIRALIEDALKRAEKKR